MPPNRFLKSPCLRTSLISFIMIPEQSETCSLGTAPAAPRRVSHMPWTPAGWASAWRKHPSHTVGPAQHMHSPPPSPRQWPTSQRRSRLLSPSSWPENESNGWEGEMPHRPELGKTEYGQRGCPHLYLLLLPSSSLPHPNHPYRATDCPPRPLI